MNKKLTLAAVALLALTGCAADSNDSAEPTPAPETTTVTVTAEPESTETPEPANTPTPEPTTDAASPEAAQAKEYFSGTTLKGNDLTFIIHDKETHRELNTKLEPYNLTGSWGMICSYQALPEQLTETAIESYSPNGNRSVWKSMKYAFAENNQITADTELIAEALAEVSSQTHEGRNCAMVYSSNVVAQVSTSTASVGRYMGADTVNDLAPLDTSY